MFALAGRFPTTRRNGTGCLPEKVVTLKLKQKKGAPFDAPLIEKA
jgi:hypothetical protein